MLSRHVPSPSGITFHLCSRRVTIPLPPTYQIGALPIELRELIADRENYDISTSTLTGFCSASELPVLLFFGGSGRGRTYTPFGLDLQSSEPAKCSTLPYFLYTLQGSNL